MCVLSLLRRFVSSIIDKLFILIFFILCIHIFFDVTELGTYSAILELSSKSRIYDDHLYKIDILLPRRVVPNKTHIELAHPRIIVVQLRDNHIVHKLKVYRRR